MATSDYLSGHGTQRGSGVPHLLRGSGAMRWIAAFLVIVVAIAMWRREIIASPPYWDAATGLWMEANFLADTGFDYRRLRNDEKSVWEGGANCYVTSVLPTLLALLMRAAPTPQWTIVSYHFFSFAAAALVLLVLYSWLHRAIGTVAAALVALALMTNPLFGAQVDMLGMDLQMTAVAMIAATCLLRGSYVWAAVASTAAFFFKASGSLVTMASIAYLAFLLLTSAADADRGTRRRYAAGLAANLAALALELFLIRWGGTVGRLLEPQNRSAHTSLLLAQFWCPDLVVIFACSLVGSAAIAATWLANALHPPGRFTLRQFTSGLHAALGPAGAVPIVSWMIIFGTLFSITRIIFLPRYLTLAVPFLFAVLGLLLFRGARLRWARYALLCGLVLFNLANAEGRFFPPVEDILGRDLARTGAILERSREYLRDHRSNLDAVRLLDEKCRGNTLVLGAPFHFFLAFPRMGYVGRPLRGYTINDFTDSVPYFRDLATAGVEDHPRSVVLVRVGNSWYFDSARFLVPAPTSDDEKQYDDGRSTPLVVFRRVWSEKDWPDAELETWYLRQTWPWATPSVRGSRRAEYRLRNGQTELALEEARRELDGSPADVGLRLLLGDLLLHNGSTLEAIDAYLTAVGFSLWRIDPDALANFARLSLPELRTPLKSGAGVHSAGGHVAAGKTLEGLTALTEGRPEKAVAVFQETFELAPGDVVARFALGSFLFHQGRFEEAGRHLQAIVDDHPETPAARRLLGLVRLIEQDYVAAIEHLSAAARQCPQSAEVHYDLAVAYARQGNMSQAREHYGLALAARPTFAAARRALAGIEAH